MKVVEFFSGIAFNLNYVIQGHLVDLVQREVQVLLQSALDMALCVVRANPNVLEGLGAYLEGIISTAYLYSVYPDICKLLMAQLTHQFVKIIHTVCFVMSSGFSVSFLHTLALLSIQRSLQPSIVDFRLLLVSRDKAKRLVWHAYLNIRTQYVHDS